MDDATFFATAMQVIPVLWITIALEVWRLIPRPVPLERQSALRRWRRQTFVVTFVVMVLVPIAGFCASMVAADPEGGDSLRRALVSLVLVIQLFQFALISGWAIVHQVEKVEDESQGPYR